jgi:hypothetical protein
MRDLMDIFNDLEDGIVLWAEIEDFLPEEVRLPEYEGKPSPVRYMTKEDYLASRSPGNT